MDDRTQPRDWMNSQLARVAIYARENVETINALRRENEALKDEIVRLNDEIRRISSQALLDGAS